MADYKISQKPKKPAKPSIKSFWTPKLQAKKLNPKNVIIVLVIAGVVIAVGIVFAAIKFTGSNPKPSSSQPLTVATTNGGPAKSAVTVTAAEIQAVKNAAAAKNAGLLNAYFAARVKVVIIDSNINQTVNANQAAGLINNGLNYALNPWNFNVPASELQGWQNGPYGQYFSGTVEVGVSANGDVISVGFDDNGDIDSVFIAPSSILDGSNTTGSNTGSNTGSSTGSALPAPTSANARD